MKKKSIAFIIAIVLAAVSVASVLYLAFAQDKLSCGGSSEQSITETVPTNPNDDGFGTEVEM